MTTSRQNQYLMLHLETLKCLRMTESKRNTEWIEFGEICDKIIMNVNGKSVLNETQGKMYQGEALKLNTLAPIALKSSVTIELVENDVDDDDRLGSHAIKASHRGGPLP